MNIMGDLENIVLLTMKLINKNKDKKSAVPSKFKTADEIVCVVKKAIKG